MLRDVMLSLFRRRTSLSASKLFNQQTFYPAFEKGLAQCRHEAVIESPFLTVRRVNSLLPILKNLKRRDVRIIVNTRDPREHEGYLRSEAIRSIEMLQEIDIQILFTGGHHRKLAILDRRILWEGSLNIFSQNDSCEIMRRIESERLATQMIGFIKLDKHLS